MKFSKHIYWSGWSKDMKGQLIVMYYPIGTKHAPENMIGLKSKLIKAPKNASQEELNKIIEEAYIKFYKELYLPNRKLMGSFFHPQQGLFGYISMDRYYDNSNNPS